MAGVQVRARFAGVSSVAPIYADPQGTPFVPANYCVSDNDGMYSFYVDSGTYDLDFLYGGQVVKTIKDYRPAEVGPTGPANSTYTNTSELENSDVANVSAILSEPGKAGTFTIRNYADFSAQVAADPGKVNYIRSVSDPNQVWVRTTILSVGAAQTGAGSGLTVDAELDAKATLTGVSRTATNLGNFTGTTIPAGSGIKPALQSLVTAVENTAGNAATKTNATAVGVAPTAADMGTYASTLVTDGQSAKQNIVDLAAATEARVPSADLASTDPGKGAALVVSANGTTVEDNIVQLARAPVTSRFVTNLDGAVINRLGDRVFAGAANKYDGNYPNDDPANQDWYTQYERAQGRSNGIIVSSQMAVLTNDYFGAAIGGVFAAQTKHFIPGVGGAIGLEAHVVNNNTTSMHDAWALYSEATRDSEGVGAIITYEADARNKGSYHAVTPWNQNAKQSVVLQVASGGALSGVGVEDVSAGINIRENPTKFGVGIVVGRNAIRGTDGVTGYGNAILCGIRQRLTWMNSADQEVTNIGSTVTNVANKNGVEFSDSGTLFLGPTNNVTFFVSPSSNVTNYVSTTAAPTGVAPRLEASGSDADIDLKLTSKGTGTIAFGNANNFVANGTGAATFGNTLPAGLSLTVKKWLAIHDHTGAFFVLPLFGV